MTEFKHSVFGTTGTSSVPKEAKEETMSMDDFRSLVETGCIHDSISIGDKTFAVRSLNALERNQLAQFLGTNPDDQKMFIFNLKVLATAIETVNGKPLEDFHTNKNLDPMTRREEILSVMQSPVLVRLLDFYNSISLRCDTQFNVEEAKNL